MKSASETERNDSDIYLSNSYVQGSLVNNTLFKRKFKFYKQRSVPLDISSVMEFRNHDAAAGTIRSNPSGTCSLSSSDLASHGLKPFSEWVVTEIVSRPGLFILSDVFIPSSHLSWIERSLLQYPEFPNLTNVHLHVPGCSDIFAQYRNKLRWATLGFHYDWKMKTYPSEGTPLPSELRSVSSIISEGLGLGPMDADATIVNYYFPKCTLSPHVDRSERYLSQPLISFSFGQSAIYLTGGTDLDDSVDALFLHSGDVLVMYGAQRIVYHAVARIEKTRNFESDVVSKSVLDYANSNRVSITVRQVEKHLS